MPHDTKASDLPPITTLLTPAERQRVDAAGEGCYRTLHRDTVDDLIRDLKSRRVQAVLVSVSCAGAQAARVASLVREFPRVPAVAILIHIQLKNPPTVLTPGQSAIPSLADAP